MFVCRAEITFGRSWLTAERLHYAGRKIGRIEVHPMGFAAK